MLTRTRRNEALSARLSVHGPLIIALIVKPTLTGPEEQRTITAFNFINLVGDGERVFGLPI